MSITVTVNGLSLVHKGSTGLAIATLPDVCKTPSPGGPVPIPYPNISEASSLKNGTKSVTADGEMAAVKGSEFSSSHGDEAGTAGGVKSGSNMKEAKFILYSFDVKMEGKNACRLMDKMTCNAGNTVCLGGEAQPNVMANGIELTKIACDCINSVAYDSVKNIDVDDYVKCLILGSFRHSCVSKKIRDQGGPEKGVHMGGGANYESGELPTGRSYCRPDIVLAEPGVKSPIPATAMKKIYDLKFQCNQGDLKPASEWSPKKALGSAQRRCYERIKLPGGQEKPGGVKVESIAPTKENCA